MGSFPIILRFDSLGWYFLKHLLLIRNNLYIYILIFFWKKKTSKTTFLKLNLSFYNCSVKNITKPFFKNNLFSFIFSKKINNFVVLLENIFYLNKNILFIDYDFNFNYLPISNSSLFSRSSFFFKKYIKYFNIGVVLFLNLKNKKFIFKKLFSKKTINISVGFKSFPNKFDLGLTLSDNRITHYILYLLIINTYFFIKNKSLNINGSTLFFF